MTREELNQEKQQEIIAAERRERRKKITILVFKILCAIVVGFTVFYLYTTYISSGLLTIKENRIIDKNLPNNFSGLKVIQISDLHYGTTVFQTEVEELVRKINKRKPDLVIFTGDLVDKNYDINTSEQEELINLLKKITATLGKYAVPGEEDDDLFYIIMKQSEFNVLENDYDLIYKDDMQPIILIGLGTDVSSKSISNGFAYFNDPTHNSNIYTIVAGHEPDSIDAVLNSHEVNLYLAGHSHNGTIRLPIIGGIYKKDGANKYIGEYYKVGKTKLYISSGLGTTEPGFRLFCRPSFNFFRISTR